MEFPMLNITVSDWSDNDPDAFILFEERIYDHAIDHYYSKVLRHKFVDCRGDIYEVTGLEKFVSQKTWLFGLIKGSKEHRLQFVRLEEKTKLEEIKEYLIPLVKKWDNAESSQRWIQEIHQAQSIHELLE